MTVPRFAVPWWWRTDFSPRLRPGQRAQLVVNGVVGAAAVWVNGHRLATPATVNGAYTRFAFDITPLLRRGTNTVAIEIHPNDPNKMFTLDDVDWNQIPPDNNTGIQFPVQLQVGRAAGRRQRARDQHNAPGLTSSALTVKADITNSSGAAERGRFSAAISAARPARADCRDQPPGDRAGARHADRDADAGRQPGAADRPPPGLVAVPDGRPAAVHPGDLDRPGRAGAELHARAVRHQDRDLVPHGQVPDGTGGRAGVRHQRQAVRRARRRVLARTCSCTTRRPTSPGRSCCCATSA